MTQPIRIKTLASMQAEVYETNIANGWFESARSFGDDIALLHSEVSEAFEAYRDHGLEDMTADDQECGCGKVHTETPTKPEGVGSEFADILVRLLDSCERHGVDLQWEFDRKLAYNKTRGHRHGGKRV